MGSVGATGVFVLQIYLTQLIKYRKWDNIHNEDTGNHWVRIVKCTEIVFSFQKLNSDKI